MERRLFDLLKQGEKGNALDRESLDELIGLGYADALSHITSKGLDALEPYRVKRAIIMAAGFGSRMAPLTLTTPKPLVRVNELRLIDTLLQRLVAADITDITIVRGYLKDKFDELLTDYPFLKFVDNDKYASENNISSAVLVADLLPGAYLCEGDFYITGKDVIEKYQYESNYLCQKVDMTDDWCFDVDSCGRAVHYRKGGKNCCQAFGISYWNEADGKLLAEKLRDMYQINVNKNKFWEMCVFEDYADCFHVASRLINSGGIIEVDSLDELEALRARLATDK